MSQKPFHFSKLQRQVGIFFLCLIFEVKSTVWLQFLHEELREVIAWSAALKKQLHQQILLHLTQSAIFKTKSNVHCYCSEMGTV